MPITDPRAQIVTEEQAILDIELFFAFRQGPKRQSNEDWFDEQIAAQKAAEAVAALPDAAPDPSAALGNQDQDAALLRLHELLKNADLPLPSGSMDEQGMRVENLFEDP